MYFGKPRIISRDRIEEIAMELLPEVPENNNGIKNWIFTVTPDGEIIKPENMDYGHPAMAEYQIYPNNATLKMLADYFFKKKNPKESTELMPSVYKSYFMIFYGYINIDGSFINNEFQDIIVRYNSQTTNNCFISNNNISKNLEKEGVEINDTNSEEHSGKEQLELSEKVPFFRKKILDLLEKYNLNENQIDELLGRLGKDEKQFLDELEEQFEKERVQDDHDFMGI